MLGHLALAELYSGAAEGWRRIARGELPGRPALLLGAAALNLLMWLGLVAISRALWLLLGGGA